VHSNDGRKDAFAARLVKIATQRHAIMLRVLNTFLNGPGGIRHVQIGPSI
jgi:hypothetical protein